MDRNIHLSLRHYYRIQPIKCSVVSGDLDNFFTIASENVSEFNDHVIKGDPVIFGKMLDKNDIKISGGHIISINEDYMQLIISPDKTYSASEKREHERFPVSLLGYIKKQGRLQKGYYIYLKDISYSGFRMYSSAELNIEDTVTIDLYFQNNVLSVEAMVMRKAVSYGRNEYGMLFIFRSKNSIYSVRDYLDVLIGNEKKLLMKYLMY